MLKAAGQQFVINNLSLGLDWSVPSASVELPYLLNAKNVNLTSLRMPEKRGGCTKLYATAYIASTPIQSIYDYHDPAGDQYVLIHCGTKIGYYSSGWHDVKTGLTANYRCSFAAYAGYVYGANGINANFKIRGTTSSTLGVSAPTTDPIAVAGAISTTSQTDSYAFTVSSFWAFRENTTNVNITETFTMPVKASITSISLWLKKIGSPTGSIWCEIWTRDGNALGIQIGQDSATVDVSTLTATGTGAVQAFTFSDMPELDIGQEYFIVLHGDNTLDGSNYVNVGRSTGSANPYPPGISARINQAGSIVWLGPDLYFTRTYLTHSGDGLTGKYKWVYCYKNTAGVISNPSDASNVLDLTSQSADVTVAYTTNADITDILLYRTLNMYELDPDNINEYFLASSVANDDGGGTVDITDASSDNDLTDILSYDNTVPPKATYLVTFQDRLIYAKCPDEEDGESLFMISKPGMPEACPSLNYHYFDRDDGNAITGLGALPDYLVVFKRNKIAVMDKNFSEWKTISDGIGCVAPYAIITMTDKIIFLSEEGPKATDGITVFDIGKKVKYLQDAGFWPETVNWTGAYYPLKHQFLFNSMGTLSHGDGGGIADKGSFMLVGHWLSSLYKEVTPEFDQQDIYVGWTWHLYETYSTHSFRTIGTYIDFRGITRLIAGSNLGLVYQLDFGYDDDGTAILMQVQTPFVSMNTPDTITKTVRQLNLTYRGSGASDVDVYIDVDFDANSNYITLTGGSSTFSDSDYPYKNSIFSGVASNTINENFNIDTSACGRLFSLRIQDSGSDGPFSLCRLEAFYRIEGIR